MSRLNQVLAFANVASGAVAALAHNININGRAVLPDIVTRDNNDFAIVSVTTTLVTVRNDSDGVASLNVWLQRQHTFDRAYGPDSLTDLTPQPFIPAAGGGGDGLGPTYGLGPTNEGILQPEFVTPQLVNTIYARTTGNDVTGDGSLLAPYETMVRAVRDIPITIPPGVRYIVDITGLNETLPEDYELPTWKAAESISQSLAPYNRYFYFTAAVQIQAEPQVVVMVPPEDATIVQADITQSQPDPVTNFVLITTVNPASRPDWANAKGKFLVLADTDTAPALNSCVILEATDTTLLLSKTSNVAAAGFPCTIREPGATLTGSSVSVATTNRGSLNAYNVDSIAFNGIKITTTTGPFGLVCNGNGQAAAQLCELDRAQFSSMGINQTRVFNNWVYGDKFRAAGLLVLSSNLLDTIGQWALLNMEFIQIARCGVFGGVTLETVAQAPGSSRYANIVPSLRVENVLIKDIVGATADGIRFNGGKAQFDRVVIDGCGRDGIRCTDDIGFLRLNNVRSNVANGVTANVNGVGDTFTFDGVDTVTLDDAAALFTPDMAGKPIIIAGATTPANDGTYIIASVVSTTQITYVNAAGVSEAFAGTWNVWTGVGIMISDGMQCVVDSATSAAGTGNTLRGAGGDMKVGTLAVRSWADFVANAPIKNQFDLVSPFVTNVASGVDLPAGDDVTGAGTGGCSGSRLFQRT